MADDKSPRERAADLFVYAPIGLAILARDLGTIALADMAKRGRSEIDQVQKRVGNQVTQYRFIGQYAVDHEIGPRLGPVLGEVRRVLGLLTGGVPDATSAEPFVPTPASPSDSQLRPSSPVTAPMPKLSTTPAAGSAAGNGAAGNGASAPDRAAERAAAAALPIPDYDELSASHVVERLAGLTPSELQMIAAYESSRRRRKTVLSRIDQLSRPGG